MMYILKKRCIHTDTNLKAHVQPKHNASIPGTACTWYIILEFLWSCSAGKTGSTLNYNPTYKHTILTQYNLTWLSIVGLYGQIMKVKPFSDALDNHQLSSLINPVNIQKILKQYSRKFNIWMVKEGKVWSSLNHICMYQDFV